MEFIRNYVWYLEARPAGGPQSPPQMGSGVVICLYKKNIPNSHRRFLLTCRHVIRGKHTHGAEGHGDPLGEILCWKPNLGYTASRDFLGRQSGACPGAWIATVSELTPQDQGDLAQDLQHPARDWVLLEVKGQHVLDDFQLESYVPGWSAVGDGEVLDIVGFPGGASTWRTNSLVQNITSAGATTERMGPTGTLKLNGADTTGGMSGGGVFNSRGYLVGIHRARTEIELATGAVSAKHLASELHLKGWEVQTAAADPLREVITGSDAVSRAFVSLAAPNLLTHAAPNDRNALSDALKTLKEDLTVMRDCKEAHELLLHQAGLRIRPLLNCIKKATIPETADEAALEKAGILDLLSQNAIAFETISTKCVPHVSSSKRLARDLLAVTRLLADPLTTPSMTEQAVRLKLQSIIATGPADFQHEISLRARALGFDKIATLVANLFTNRVLPPGQGLEGLMKLAPLKEEVSRLVMEHEAWQDFDRELRPIEEKIRNVEKGREGEIPDIQFLVSLLVPYARILQKTQTAYTDEFTDFMLSLRAFVSTFELVDPEPTTAVKLFDATRSKADYLFSQADFRLLSACQNVTTIIGPIENLIPVI